MAAATLGSRALTSGQAGNWEALGEEEVEVEEEEDSQEEGQEAETVYRASVKKKSQRGIFANLVAGDVFAYRRFGMPLWRPALCLLVELLFCVGLSRASSAAGSGELPGAGATRWLAGLAWACLALCLLLRAGLAELWRRRALDDGLLLALYMLGSSFPFLVYVSLHCAMCAAVSYVSVRPEAFLNRVDGNCTRAYVPPPVCDGAAEAYRSPQACCLVYRHVVHAPSPELVRTAGEALRWVAVAAVALVWRDVPFAHTVPTDTFFMNTLWLDILDVMVFSAFLIDGQATYLARGINLKTARSQPKDRRLLGLLWFMWIFAFMTALLSRSLYMALRLSSSGKPRETRWSFGSTTSDLLRSIRFLDEARAHALVREAIRMQAQQYRDAESEEGTPVMVDAPAPSESWMYVHADAYNQPQGRVGWARMARPGEYHVEFDDGMRPWELCLPVERLEPAFEQQLGWLGLGSCQGWGDPTYVLHGTPCEVFERRAKVLDALRSLVCLELPFMCVRWNLEVRATGCFSIWLLKNLVCAIMDVMMIAAFGNEAATCLSVKPLRRVSALLSAAPRGLPSPDSGEGLHHIAEDPAARQATRYRQDVERLSQHKAWLTLERKKAEEQAARFHSEDALLAARAPYERELQRADLELARIASQMHCG